MAPKKNKQSCSNGADSKTDMYLLAKGKLLIEQFEHFQNLLNSLTDQVITDSIIKRIRIESNIFDPLIGRYTDFLVEASANNADLDDFPSLSEFQCKYTDLKVTAEALLETNITVASPIRNSNDSFNVTRSQTEVKLPTINLPTFSGEQQNFRDFFENFEALVDSNANITPVQKFLYLRNCLRGTPKQVISELKATASNYCIAVELLKERYDNRKFLIFSHFDSLLNFQRLAKESQLRSYYDNLITHIRAIENEKINPEEYKNAVIAYITRNKVDSHTSEEFAKLFPKRIPSVEETSKFLSDRCNIIDETNNSFSKTPSYEQVRTHALGKKFHSNSKSSTLTLARTTNSCTLCKSDHFLNHCPTFLKLVIKERFNKVKSLNLCTVCLRHNNKIKCTSTTNCRHCNERHNSLLCFKNSRVSSNSYQINTDDLAPTGDTNTGEDNGSSSTSFENASTSVCGLSRSSEVLLSTVEIKIVSGNRCLTVRGLLDSGSQNNLITEQLHKRLNSPCDSINLSLKGVNNAITSCSKYTSIQLYSTTERFKTNIECLIVPTITDQLPRVRFDKERLDIPPHIRLADSSFNEPGDIDILIGSSHFYKLLLPQKVSLGASLPTLQNTLLGWIVSGDIPKRLSTHSTSHTTCGLSTVVCHTMVDTSNDDTDLHRSLTQFWDLDNSKPRSKLALLSPEERFCETQFLETIRFDDTGHLSVSIPFNSRLPLLGDSKRLSESRFINLERRFQRDPDLLKEYSQFMREYKDFGHMSEITEEEIYSPSATHFVDTLDGSVNMADIPPQFFPHHAVIKQSSLTTKLRVVFDASAKTSTNISINDTQLVGPRVQDNLFDILLRFRSHEVALCGDIAKMYRMINVDPVFRKLQHILWRESPDQPLSVFRLNTVTYGTGSASYLATRCLLYLAEINKDLYPESSEIISKNFYMDDLLFSTDSVEKAIRFKKEISAILATAGFTIRKFLSNKPDLLESTGEDETELSTVPIGERSDSKTLGVHWDAINDFLFCKTNTLKDDSIPTKRKILSLILKVFDPLGFYSPFLVRGKLLIQKLWQSGVDWDDTIPSELVPEWDEFKSQLTKLGSTKIRRCVIPSQTVEIQLHGFSDASSSAYGCCFFLRCRTSNGDCFSNLLFSKSRVAPLRTISIPRLELCAAVLMAEWYQKFKDTFDVSLHKVFLWTDSQIVLNWINSTPNKYKVFVANRIATIQECTNTRDWYYISSTNNPADLVSRGSNILDSNNSQLWFHGPQFLLTDPLDWNTKLTVIPDETTEHKGVILINTIPNTTFSDYIFGKYSTLCKLQRVTAYVLRFAHNSLHANNKRTGQLTVQELNNSLITLTRLCQQNSFGLEIKTIRNKQNIKNSHLQSLNPFLDENDCLRVGGRLSYSSFPYDKKYPVLLPKNHNFSKLIIYSYHKRLLHCGAQQVLAAVRERFWPIGGLSYVKGLLRSCTICFKTNPSIQHPLMGELPKRRLDAMYPFYNVGLDYAGPIMIKDRHTRGARLSKAYICIFVCMVTRAMHLELVTSLSTNSFLSTLKRFIARRGLPHSISSDNATNFRGAKAKIDSLYSILHDKNSQNEIFNYLASKAITWNFINPRSPHEGGMWEISVKSVKAHLKRIIGNANLTFEDLYTSLTMIEAVLNSRPLSYLSSDPEDFTALTPGHFLIGRPLTSVPEPDLTPILEGRLTSFRRAQQMAQHFWKRWSREVVPNLQRRQKWFQRLPDLLRIDTVVLLQEDDTPPLQWRLGRVVQLHTGSNDVIRAATLKLANGHVVRRSVHRLCVLPPDRV